MGSVVRDLDVVIRVVTSGGAAGVRGVGGGASPLRAAVLEPGLHLET